MPTPFPVIRARLDRALATRDLAGVRSAARELPEVVTLADAVQVLRIMLEVDDPAFEGASVRWIARFAAESRGATLSELQAAVEARAPRSSRQGDAPPGGDRRPWLQHRPTVRVAGGT